MEEIKLKIQCKSCEGTGIYTGMGEKDGAGVICHTCDGSGCQDYSFKYKDFKGRVKCENIKRVYLRGYGYCITPKLLTFDSGITIDMTKEGVSYSEFLEGKLPKHIKNLVCPMSADQGACHNIKGFTDRCNLLNGSWLSYIPSCKCKDKLRCWKVFENPKLIKEV